MVAPEKGKKLSPRNYFEILVSFFYLFLGGIILIRSLFETRMILGMGVGGAFLALGIFRLKFIWIYFLGKSRKP